MTTTVEEILSSFPDCEDNPVDVLDGEIQALRHAERIIRTLRQEKEAVQRALVHGKYPIK